MYVRLETRGTLYSVRMATARKTFAAIDTAFAFRHVFYPGRKFYPTHKLETFACHNCRHASGGRCF